MKVKIISAKSVAILEQRINKFLAEGNGVKQCKEPKDIAIMKDRDREESHVLRKFALIK